MASSGVIVQPPAPSIGGTQEAQGPGALRGMGGTDIPGYPGGDDTRGPTALMSRFAYRVPAGDRGFVLSRNLFRFKANEQSVTVGSGSRQTLTVQVQSNDRVVDCLDSCLRFELAVEPNVTPADFRSLRYWPIPHLAGTRQFLDGMLEVDSLVTRTHDNQGPFLTYTATAASGAKTYVASNIPIKVQDDGKTPSAIDDIRNTAAAALARGMSVNASTAVKADDSDPTAVAGAAPTNRLGTVCLTTAENKSTDTVVDLKFFPMSNLTTLASAHYNSGSVAVATDAAAAFAVCNSVISATPYYDLMNSASPYNGQVPYLPLSLASVDGATQTVRVPSQSMIATEGPLVASSKTRQWMRDGSRGSFENLVNRLKIYSWSGQTIEEIEAYNLLARLCRDATDRDQQGDAEKQSIGRGMTMYDLLESLSTTRVNKNAPGYAWQPGSFNANIAGSGANGNNKEDNVTAASTTVAYDYEKSDAWSRSNVLFRMISSPSSVSNAPSTNLGRNKDQYDAGDFPYRTLGAERIECILPFDFSGILGNEKYLPLKYLRALNIEVTLEQPQIVLQYYKDAVWAYMKLADDTLKISEFIPPETTANAIDAVAATGNTPWSDTNAMLIDARRLRRDMDKNQLANIGRAFKIDSEGVQFRYTVSNAEYLCVMVELSNLMKNVLDKAANQTSAIPYTYTTWYHNSQIISSSAASIIISKQCTHALMALACFRTVGQIQVTSEDAFATNGFCLTQYQWRQGNDYYPIKPVTEHNIMYQELRRAFVVRGDLTKQGLEMRRYRNDILNQHTAVEGYSSIGYANQAAPSVRRSPRDGWFALGVSLQTSPGVEGSGINNGGGVNLTLDLVWPANAVDSGKSDIMCDYFMCYNRVLKIAGDGTLLIQE